MINISTTGHRPSDLYGYDIYSEKYSLLRDKFLEVLNQLKKEYEIDKFYNGLALGWDTVSYEEVYFDDNNIKIIACKPFSNQSSCWLNERDKKIYGLMIECANEVVEVDTLDLYQVKWAKIGEYDPVKLQKRNEYMVDNSQILISCWNGKRKGGTYNCVKYAMKKDNIRNIININPIDLEVTILKGN